MLEHKKHWDLNDDKATKYVYTKLNQIALGKTETLNLYGVIIDASSSYQSKGYQICQIKVIDQSLNLKSSRIYNNKAMDHQVIVFFANHQKDQPQVFRLGDIIRVHRANSTEYNNSLQVIGNLYGRSSWVIFQGQPEYTHSYKHKKSNKDDDVDMLMPNGFIRIFDNPEDEYYYERSKQQLQLDDELDENDLKYYPIACSSSSYSFNDSEKEIIDNLRRWSYDYLKSNPVFASETQVQTQIHVDSHGQSYYKDFDILAKIISLEVIDDIQVDIRIKDLAGIIFQLSVKTIRHRLPQLGQVIRVRGAKININYNPAVMKGNSQIPVMLELHHPSNIIHIPQYYKQALILNERVIEDELMKKLILNTDIDKNLTMGQPLVITQINKQYNEMPYTSLFELYHKPAVEISYDFNQHDIMRMKVFTLGFLPSNIREMTQLYCKRCLRNFSFQELETDNSLPIDQQIYKCNQCGDQCRPIYMMALIVKDDSTAGTDRCYKLYYYSHDQPDGEELFGGLRPANLYKDEKSREMLGNYIQLFTKFNIYLDVIVKRRFAESQREEVYQIIDGRTKSFHLEMNN
ncbi:alpha telomere binding protein [Stylonychia lemnae]|uniref:Alpha telomere binding protein n=1 Tax=Stylonychia lemnae TaxID=5949 RepID=A0A078AUF8_STYLE|nr:alpha telomere binding protein [Stylonychia lemnae]|eukprot:CDW85854.1 alpha telomere binding protein [Stylonychia lemnae]